MNQTKLANIVPRKDAVALFGIFGIGNIGNEATLRVTLDQLKARQPGSVPTVICPHPDVVTASFGIKALNWDPKVLSNKKSARNVRSRLLRWLLKPFSLLGELLLLRRTLKSFGLLVVPGTGILDDYALTSQAMPANMLLWCCAARLARVPVIFASIGAGPIQNKVSRRLMTWIALTASRRSYRDELSRQFLGGLGLNVKRDLVLPDLVFSHPLATIPLNQKPRSARHGVVGIGMMGYFGWAGNSITGQPIYQAYISRMARFVEHLLNEGFEIRFLIGKDSDESAIADVMAILPAKSEWGPIHRPIIKNMDDLLLAINETDVVVATRYHDVERLKMQFEQLFSRRDKLGKCVEQRIAEYRLTLSDYFDSIFPPAEVK
jgi:polysaccharide pyruvyl transferase WcaK-like protein